MRDILKSTIIPLFGKVLARKNDDISQDSCILLLYNTSLIVVSISQSSPIYWLFGNYEYTIKMSITF
jgi:hypothetical protein